MAPRIRQDDKDWARRFLLAAAVFVLVFAGSYALLNEFNLAPQWRAEEAPEVVEEANAEQRLAPEEGDADPVRVIIEKIGVDSTIVNPQSSEVAVLDAALREGVVHYPGSGALNDTSNMFLFGHSSNLPAVRNEAYQALNDIEQLNLGDVIRVYSDAREYRYEVTNLRRASAEEVLVSFETGEKKLTLSTCDTFGEKDDRFVVEAVFVGSSVLAG